MSIAPGTRIDAFTANHLGRANQIITEVTIILPNTNIKQLVKAIWDTGATASVITEKIVNALGLKPTGMSNVITANGPTVQSTYIVDIVLPNNLQVRDVTVTGAPGFSSDCDVLIGMDIISLGDFSITNFEGNTCLSFRFPSCHKIDYVASPHQGIKPFKHIPQGAAGSNFTKKKKRR